MILNDTIHNIWSETANSTVVSRLKIKKCLISYIMPTKIHSFDCFMFKHNIIFIYERFNTEKEGNNL